MKAYRNLVGLLLLCVAFLCCLNCSAGPYGNKKHEVVIISTNDIHAQIARFPLFATFVKQKREECKDVILVDAGDRFSGNPYVDNAAEKGEPMITLMNKLGYDVATLGNHDFDYGQVTLSKRKQEAGFEILCANMDASNSVLGKFAPYQVLEKGGIKYCFFSLIQTGRGHIPATNPDNLKDIVFTDYRDVIQQYKELEKQCDVFIGLTHLGFYGDSLLALAMPELDMIIGGHSHTLIKDTKLINGVLVGQAGSNLQYAGVTTLTFKGKKLVGKNYQVVKLSDIGEADPEVALLVEEIENRPEFQRVLGKVGEIFENKEQVASLMTDAMCDAVDCDFAFYNKGGVRVNSLPAGDINVETVYRMEPFNNYIVVHQWTLEEMKRFIMSNFNRIGNPAERYINYYISQGRYEIIRDRTGNAVDVIFYDKDNKPLSDVSRKYNIAFSNYVSSSDEFVRNKTGRDSEVLISDAILRFIEKKGTVDAAGQRAFIK